MSQDALMGQSNNVDSAQSNTYSCFMPKENYLKHYVKDKQVRLDHSNALSIALWREMFRKCCIS